MINFQGSVFLICFLVICHLVPSAHAGQFGKVRLKKNIVLEVEKVVSRKDQRFGLGNRDFLKRGSGMLFMYKYAGQHVFWMKRMKIPIDIVWIYRGKVVHIKKNVQPPRSIMIPDSQLTTYGAGIHSDMVLEIPANYSSQIGLKNGDSFQIIN
ncbi:MAG: DUF192 domain-containing protein [Proteobacteria bacterium]|nr:DUF192 domain-containing protein [Pseudomonadota bacterium]